MQEAQRAAYNHALEYAIQKAKEPEKSLLVVFGLTEVYRRFYKPPGLPRRARFRWGRGSAGARDGLNVSSTETHGCFNFPRRSPLSVYCGSGIEPAR